MALWIKNAVIATMDSENPKAESAVVMDDFFAYVGSEAGAAEFIEAHAVKDVEEVDMGGQFMLPGFNDSHMHYLHYAKAKKGAVNLTGCTSIKEVLERMKDGFENMYDKNSGLWLSGEGWNHDYFTDEKRFPNSKELDTVTTEYPMIIMRACFHVAVMNSKAMELLNITKETVGQYGVFAETYEDGEPNGVIKENVFDDIKANLPAPSLETLLEMMIDCQDDLFEAGITSIQSDDFKYTPDGHAYEMMHLIREATEQRRMKVRMAEQALLTEKETVDQFFDEKGFDDSYGNRSFKITCVKSLADGSLGARTALMRKPYEDDPSTKGLAIYETQEELDYLVMKAHRNNMAAAIHAIGDGAVEMCLNAIERARREMPYLHPRHGIVHCQVTDKEQVRRFKELDVIAYIQPVFIDYDMHVIFDRVGKELGDTSYAWKDYIESGVHAPFGTDCPVEDFNPMRGIYCAVTSCDTKGFGPGWPHQILSREQALYGYTAAGAYASFDEDVKGKVKAGMYADFITVDTNLLTCADEEILGAKFTRTYINVKKVFER
ncbi:MAG: amidohydrolase [Lachnospiraceae bacterium]|nr:amidohydrolase [Lachnospiraceae bacterium]